MALIKIPILRRPPSGRLEGRTPFIQLWTPAFAGVMDNTCYARPQRRLEAIAAPSAIACNFLNEMSGSSLP